MSLRYLVTSSLLGVSIAISACGSGDKSGGSSNAPACSSTTQCAPPTPYCDTGAGHCVECIGDDNCGNFGQRFCEPSSHSCVACLTDANCGAGQPYCSSDHRCVECLTGANCGDPALTCNNNSNCVPTCASDADCAGVFGNATVCDTARSFCVQCLADANCPGDNPYCVENSCEECLTDENCAGAAGQPYCSPNHNCVECLTDANCPNGGTCGNDLQCNG